MIFFGYSVGARVTSSDDDEDVPRRVDASKNPRRDGRARTLARGYFLLAGKRRARRADNHASETMRSLVRSPADAG